MPETVIPTPTLECDLVLRGGVTSGIVYPSAIARIAERYRFRSIGGASAGAIGAAFAAAGECGRARGRPDAGFALLSGVIDEISRPGFVSSLFQPHPDLRYGFELLTFARQRAWWAAIGVVWRSVSATRRAGIVSTWILAVIAFVYTIVRCVAGRGSWGEALALIAAVPLAGWGLSLALRSVRAFVQSTQSGITDNFFGLCSGTSTAPGSVALSEWIHTHLQALAGKQSDQPLTFGDLWHPLGSTADSDATRQIDLRVMVTNLTLSRPHCFPLGEEDPVDLYFDPEELARVMPRCVVDHMVNSAPPAAFPPESATKLLPLPSARELPVLFAVRASLAFPLLISAVPVYARDHQRAELVPCWLSDGGISSNFPVHLFDTPIPTRPTFGIVLLPATAVEHDEQQAPQQRQHARPEDLVFLPTRMAEGHGELWNVAPTDHGRLPWFVSAILETATSWHDNQQMRLPGFRERIARVFLRESEGGLNLDMDQKTLTDLVRRGTDAGNKLANKFSNPNSSPRETGWKEHRWTRFRASLPAAFTWFRQFRVGYERTSVPGDRRAIADLVSSPETLRSQRPQLVTYPFPNEHQQHAATELAGDIVRAAECQSSDERVPAPDKDPSAPRPHSRLRTVPLIMG